MLENVLVQITFLLCLNLSLVSNHRVYGTLLHGRILQMFVRFAFYPLFIPFGCSCVEDLYFHSAVFTLCAKQLTAFDNF